MRNVRSVLLILNFEVVAINYLSNGINVLVGNDVVPVKFEPKGTDPQYEGCAFHVSHAARRAVSYSRPS